MSFAWVIGSIGQRDHLDGITALDGFIECLVDIGYLDT